MNHDEDHLRLLAIFHYVCAGLGAMIACFPIMHLIFGLVMVLSPESFGSGKEQPPAFLGWFFVSMASLFILAGWTWAALIAWAGRCLNRRKHYLYCFVMACVACLFMPFGTVLGAFTIIVLVRPTVKMLFGVNAQPA
jgi:hypothetical protein